MGLYTHNVDQLLARVADPETRAAIARPEIETESKWALLNNDMNAVGIKRERKSMKGYIVPDEGRRSAQKPRKQDISAFSKAKGEISRADDMRFSEAENTPEAKYVTKPREEKDTESIDAVHHDGLEQIFQRIRDSGHHEALPPKKENTGNRPESLFDRFRVRRR